MDILLVVILSICGVALLVVEIFLIPGIGFAGLAGVASMVAAVFCAYYYIGATAGHITLGCLLVLTAIAIWLFVRSRMLERMALKTEIKSKIDLVSQSEINIGEHGVTISRLAPMGKVRIGGKEFEAKSAEAFIDQNSEIEVVSIEGNTVIVKRAL